MNPSWNLLLEEQSMLSTLLTQPHRKYHNIVHINDSLAEAYKMLNANEKYEEYSWQLIRAIWYHDAIYNPYAPQGLNEWQSAGLFYDYTDKVNKACNHKDLIMIHDVILTTARHTEDQLNVINTLSEPEFYKLMLDIDLSGFGKDRLTFALNGMNIRHEYHTTPIRAFINGRLNFYKMLTQRDTLYYSEYFRDLYHTKSQENIEWEISVLEDALVQDDVSIWGEEMMLALDGY